MEKNQKSNRLDAIRARLSFGDTTKISRLAGVHRIWVIKVLKGEGTSERVLQVAEEYLSTKKPPIMKKSKKYFEVTYDKKVGGEGKVVVKADNEPNALINARHLCFTGSNFREPVEVEKQATFSQQHPNGRCGLGRAN